MEGTKEKERQCCSHARGRGEGREESKGRRDTGEQEVEKQKQPQSDNPSFPLSSCRFRGRIKYFTGASILLSAAGVTGVWTLSGRRIRSELRNATKSKLSLEARFLKEHTVELTLADEEGLLQPCYSSPEADPSKGEWRSCSDGVRDSPAKHDDWAPPETEFGFLHQCDNKWQYLHRLDPGVPRPYWAWEPTDCRLDAFNEEKFCRVMEGRKGILLVGDSLTRLSTTTLASILRAKPVKTTSLMDNWSACGGQLNVRFIRNDVLDVRTAPPFPPPHYCEYMKGGTRCKVFATDDILREFDTLVVNSGAHPRSVEKFSQQMDDAARTLTSSMHRLHGEDKAILVVRNTVPGHWGCTERIFSAPVNASVAEELVAAAPEMYMWSSFEEFNSRLQEAFSPDKGWRLLDAYTPTSLRADTHIGGRDCLHYCLPGPADHWIVLLYNILLSATNSA